MVFRIDRGQPLRDEVMRIVAEAGAEVAGSLDPAAVEPAAGFHDARKGLKRLRALLRLVRPASPRQLREIEHLFRDAARELAAPREAQAMVETLDRLIAEFPERIVDCRLGEIRCHLLAPASGAGFDAAGAAARARAACLEGCDRVALIDFARGGDDGDVLAAGMRHTLEAWADALAAARRHGRPDDFHDLRKAVKAHAAQYGLLRDAWPKEGRRRRERLEALGERLGELNDAHTMRDALRSGALSLPDGLEARNLDRLLKQKAKPLCRAVLARSAALLDDAPGKLRHRLRPAAIDKRAA